METTFYTIDNSQMDKNREKYYLKNYPRETVSCRTQLDKAKDLLNQGLALGTFYARQIKNEGNGLWRVAPRIDKHTRAEIRLYFWFHFDGKTLYPLTIGDKRGQEADIAECKKRIARLRESC